MAPDRSGENDSLSSEEDFEEEFEGDFAIDAAAKKVAVYINQDSPKLIERAKYMPFHGSAEEGTDAGHILGVGLVNVILSRSPGRPLSEERKKELAKALNRTNNLRTVTRERNLIVDERRDARIAEAIVNGSYLGEKSTTEDALRKYVVALENSAEDVPSMLMIADRLAGIKVRLPGCPDTTIGEIYAEREAVKAAKKLERAEASGASSPSSSASSERSAATPPLERPSSPPSPSSSSSSSSSKLTNTAPSNPYGTRAPAAPSTPPPAAPSTPPPAAPSTPSPTVYAGVERPKDSDYISPGVINRSPSYSSSSSPSSSSSGPMKKDGAPDVRYAANYGTSGSAAGSTPSTPPPAAPSTPPPAAPSTPSPTVYAGVGRPKNSDYISPGVINYGNSDSAGSTPSTPPPAAPSTPSPTVYAGVGRPKNSDYISPGVINYGNSGSAGSTPSTPPPAAPSTPPPAAPSTPSPTVYAGVGRPKDSDYISPGVINRSPSYSSSSSPSSSSSSSSSTSSSSSSSSPSSSSSGPMKKDGTPDMRYAANRR